MPLSYLHLPFFCISTRQVVYISDLSGSCGIFSGLMRKIFRTYPDKFPRLSDNCLTLDSRDLLGQEAVDGAFL